MPRQIAAKVDNNFINGLITDATVLNFPDNFCTEAFDCVFDDSGRITRRKGLVFEGNNDTKEVANETYVVKSYIWREVNGDGTSNILVVQTGTILNFYDLSFPIVSQGEITDEIDLLDHDVAGSVNVGNYYCDFSSGNGVLFVVHPKCEPFYLTFDPSTSNLTATAVTIKIRDLGGVSDGLAVDERPTATAGTMTATHKYNIYNQGWYYDSAAALAAWDTARTDVPSNADIWWFYKDSSDAFDATLVPKRTLGNSQAPRGHYIYTAFNIDRSTVSGIAGITAETTTARPSVISFFAGRAWYGGMQSFGRTNTIYFTQILESINQAGLCYQANDPTSEDASDLLPTDGGTITIEGAGTIYEMRPLGNALLLFCSNGIWAITGSQGLGFVATDFSVMKISSVVTESGTSFVDVEGMVCWWNTEGIYAIVSTDNVTFQVQSLTDRKIRKYIVEEIRQSNKNNVVGDYNPSSKTVQWLFRSEEAADTFEANSYDRCLVYNMLTQAFYLWRFPTNHAVKIHSVFAFKGFAGSVEPLKVVVGADQVVVDADDVIAFNLEGSASSPIFKYVVSYEDAGDRLMTFGEPVSDIYVDWTDTNYESTFTTGYKIYGDGQRFFQSNYAFVFLEQEENAGGKVQAVWDWTTSGSSGKWSTQQTI